MPGHPYPQSDRELIRRIERSASHRAGYKQLIRELGLGGGRERRLLLEQLTRITARGDLIKLDNDHWSIPAAAPEKTARPPRTSIDEPQPSRITRDRLVAAASTCTATAMPSSALTAAPIATTISSSPQRAQQRHAGRRGHRRRSPPGRDGRRSGRVLRILTRRNPTVVGIFHYERSHRRTSTWDHLPPHQTLIHGNYVTPLDERMTQPILIPDGMEIPATPKATPHRVLGEEARLQQHTWNPDDENSLEGLAVDIEITDFPTPGRPARGRILEVLGPPDAFGVDVEIIIRKHHLPHTFPTNVLAEAKESAALPIDEPEPKELGTPKEPGAPFMQSHRMSGHSREARTALHQPGTNLRRDFRHLPIVTIDGETARDFDDAVLVQPLPNGN